MCKSGMILNIFRIQWNQLGDVENAVPVPFSTHDLVNITTASLLHSGTFNNCTIVIGQQTTNASQTSIINEMGPKYESY